MESESRASTFTLGIGAGITNDSDAAQEWQECHIKFAFLMDLPSATGLFETIAVKHGDAQRLRPHLERMQASALALRIPFEPANAENLIFNTCESFDKNLLYRLRLDLAPNGELSVSSAVIHQSHDPVKIFWAKDILSADVTMHTGDALLRHKISNRPSMISLGKRL